ncbi:MAG TPA: PilT/PilU family type 4a pilus ATPase [Alphaproteobacteria bacterium]|nr:PilT/PilU family type 4a pilus ATPase [Alphaproteobacteria bacterium]
METTSREELDKLLGTMIESTPGISDLLFVAGRRPQVEVYGHLESFGPDTPEAVLTSARIESLARTIMDSNPKLAEDLAKRGSCDCSYALPQSHRFRVNIYRQNGNHAMVLRKLASVVPSMDALKLAPVFRDIIKEKTGLIFVTGGTGSGKTTTLAAMLNEINQTNPCHIVTLEDPIEFMHPHLQATFSQREMGRDFYTFPDGVRAALRQAPKIIMVGEIRDRETMEIALTAGETGHLVFSTMHTISAGQTVNRILGIFTKDEEQQVRERLAGCLRYIVSQRLVPRIDNGRLLVTELMGSSLRTREAILMGENENRRLSDIIEAGSTSGWHSFEQSLLRAFETEYISEETALLYSVNKPTMRQRIDAAKKKSNAPSFAALKMREEEKPAPKPRPAPVPMPAGTGIGGSPGVSIPPGQPAVPGIGMAPSPKPATV